MVAPSSRDVSGRRYCFVSNSGLACAPLPTALRDLIFKASSQQTAGPQVQDQTANPSQQSQSQVVSGSPESESSQKSQIEQSQQAHVQAAGQGQHREGQQTQKQSAQIRHIEPAPVPWPDPVDGVVLFNELTAALGRYLALPEGASEAMALWALFTHTFDAAEVSPRLALLSPLPECGKTTAFSILRCLAHKAMLASNFSPAVIFRAIEQYHPTLMMDEADTYMEGRDDFRNILNSGHSPDGAVWRADGAKYDPKGFSTWAPIAIAKIGKLPETLESRSIIIPMRRKRPDEPVTPYRPDRDRPVLDELARKCARWAKDNVQSLKGADPLMPKQLTNRAADNWRPLFAIADAIGGDCPTERGGRHSR